jgi:hypothetical protein
MKSDVKISFFDEVINDLYNKYPDIDKFTTRVQGTCSGGGSTKRKGGVPCSKNSTAG